MRFGLIGYGAWGRHHAHAIKAAPGAALAAIACASERTAGQARAEHPGVPVYTDYRALLERADVDAVDIVVPIYRHAEVGVAALEAGKHVLLDKPMAKTIEECDALIAAQKRSGKVLSIAHDYRASRQYVQIRELIDAGELGELQYVSVNLFRNRFRQGSDDWRFSPEKVGSWILEEPVHFFDLALWYFGPSLPRSIFAVGNSRLSKPGLYDDFTAVTRFPRGYASVTQTLGGFQHHTQVQVVGTEGAVRTYWSGAMDRAASPTIGFQLRRRGAPFERGVNECETLDFQADNERGKLQNQLDRVVKAFGAGTAPTPGEEAKKRVRMCIEAERSIREAREIALEW
jgi:myo-inositol 2-dehydrogenase / D-chiro-inositol 1-dehydrogenase